MTTRMIVQLVLAFVAGCAAALVPLASDGLLAGEYLAGLAAGATAALALLKRSPKDETPPGRPHRRGGTIQ